MTLFPVLLLTRLSAEVPFRAYVADIDARSVTVAWGQASGGAGNNTIGRGAKGSGPLELTIGDRSMVSQRAWETVGDLQPDTVYPYSIRRNGETLARGAVRFSLGAGNTAEQVDGFLQALTGVLQRLRTMQAVAV